MLKSIEPICAEYPRRCEWFLEQDVTAVDSISKTKSVSRVSQSQAAAWHSHKRKTRMVTLASDLREGNPLYEFGVRVVGRRKVNPVVWNRDDTTFAGVIMKDQGLMDSVNPVNADKLEQLENRLQTMLSGRVRNLQVVLHDSGIVLRGSARTYHAKQVAQHATMSETDMPIVANEIEVC
jgi:hypothetical protein